MWTSDFPLVALLLLLNVMDLAFSNGNNDSLSVLAPKITQFKLSLHHLLEGARIRRKRKVSNLNAAHEQPMRFASSAQEDLPYLSDYNLTFWIPVWHLSQRQALIATKQGHLILFELAVEDDKFARTIAVSEDGDTVIKAKAFSHYNDQWFVALQSDASNLYHIRLYERIGRGLEKRQTITLNGASEMDLITIRNTHYLVVATYQTKTNQGYSYRAEVKLYQWIDSQFDEIATRVTYGAGTVSCWVLDGSLYMAVGQERDDEGDHRIGSPIYLYNAKEKNKLVMLEQLDTFGPKKVLHFYVSNNHYVIFIGASEAVIYWWSSGQFLPWQTIKGTANAVDVSVLTLENGEVAIVIALMEEALFLTLDVSGYYIISFVMSFAGSSLSSLQFMYSGQAYYALAVFAESFRHRSHSVYKLTVEPYNLMTGSSLDSLQECLSSMTDLLDERETELKFVNSELGRVWLTGNVQKVTSVHVTGRLSSAFNTIVRQILIVVERKLLTDSPTRDDVIEVLSRSKSLINNVRNDLDDIVLKSSSQDIKGTLEFFNPIPIPSLNMKSSNLDIAINGLFVTSLLHRALRKYGDQTFFGPISAADVSTKQLGLSSLNGIVLSDLLLLRGQQPVTGLLKFSNVQSSVISVNYINSIPIETLVLTNSDQTIFDLKSASYLNALVVDVHEQTNGQNLEEVKDKVVLTETDDDLIGKLSWNSSVIVAGDIFVPGLINGAIDLSKIAQDSVQKHTQQDLTGTSFFMTPQFVSADMTVAGLINGVHTMHLLTKDSVQSISGPVAFKEPLFVHQELITDFVNNVDLRESAVLKYPLPTHYDQFVSGFKTFADSLDVGDVDMTEYVTLDGVDPSLLMEDIVRHKEGVVKENRTTFDRVVVTGDVTALNGINGREVMDLQHMFWLKSKPQTIEANVGLGKISIADDLEAKLINFLSLDEDVVRSFGNETINSEKSFEHITSVRRLDHSRGTLVNGIDIFSFKTELEREVNEWTAHGIKFFEYLEVHGELSTGSLGDLNGAVELMQPKALQTVKGETTFSSELTIISGLLQAEYLFFDTINGVNFRNYLDNAVTNPNPSRVITNKVFPYLEGSEMQLHIESTIGRKSLFEFLPRVVTLNTMQLIPSSKIFNSALHFLEAVVANDLNGLEMSSYASRVVLKDDFKVISVPKEFTGVVKMDFIFVQNFVNGLKIEKLAESAFLKTSDNEVLAHVTFLRDVDIGQLFTNSINGLHWSHLFMTNQDEILGLSWFLSDVECAGDVFITGFIDGCDLATIQRNAFYTNKTQQVIGTEITVDSIQVLGNVVIENSTSQSQIDRLKRILVSTSDDEVISANIVIASNVFANTLKLRQLVNGIDLNLIFNDAVRHSIPQEIKSFKMFFDDVAASTFRSQGIFLQGHLAGVNLQKLMEKAVMKNGHQVIAGEKIFQFGNLMMDVVIVQGRLNGLRLPEDVIRTDTSEIITNPTFFMSDIYLNSELNVGGKMDGVDLDELLKNRISLTAEQEISSQLTFWEDVAVNGNLGVGGMINDVVLEMVVNLRQPHLMGGHKLFTSLKITGSMQTSRVNGYNPISLQKNILKFDQEEFLNEIQVFEKHLQVNSLNAEWINGISMNQLSSLAYSVLEGLRFILNVFKDVTSSVEEQLGHQLSSAGTPMSKFAYFILIQELDLGSANKILHGYRFEHSSSEFSHSMVIWTAQKHCAYMGKCCETEFTYWMRVQKSGHVVVDGEAEMGRYYPIHNPAPVSYDKDFFIWTNTTQLQPKWCKGNGKEKMQLASFSEEGRMEVFMEILHSPSLSEIKTFRSGSLYAVAGFFYDAVQGEYKSTVIYSFNEVKREWTEHQILPSFGVLSLDIIVWKNEIILALGTGMATNPESYSTIYKWNAEDKQFLAVQSVSSRFVTSTLWIPHESSLMLAMSGVQHWPRKDIDCFEHMSGGQIDIYIYENSARWIQSIPLQGVASMVSFTIAGDTFIAAASSQLQIINIYTWKGYAGFALMQSIFAGEVRHLNTYSIDGDLFMTVAKASGSSEILKAVAQGRSERSHLGYKRPALDQNDETSLEEKLVSRCR